MMAAPGPELAGNLNDASDPATRLPRIEFGATVDATLERVHKILSRKKELYVEFVWTVDQSNHPAMPPGHRWSIFQDAAYDGADSIFRGAVLALIGEPPGNPNRVDLNTIFRDAHGPGNVLSGRKARITEVSAPDKKFPATKVSVYVPGAPLPALVERARAPQPAPAPAQQAPAYGQQPQQWGGPPPAYGQAPAYGPPQGPPAYAQQPQQAPAYGPPQGPPQQAPAAYQGALQPGHFRAPDGTIWDQQGNRVG